MVRSPVAADGLLQFVDDVFGNGGPAFAEMDHAAHAAGVLHQAQGGLPVEPRKQITGKQRLRHPDRSLPRGAFETDARQEDLDRAVLPEMRRGDVLVFGLRLEAKPQRAAAGLCRRASDFCYRPQLFCENQLARAWPHLAGLAGFAL